MSNAAGVDELRAERLWSRSGARADNESYSAKEHKHDAATDFHADNSSEKDGDVNRGSSVAGRTAGD